MNRRLYETHRGIRVYVEHFEERFIPPDESEPGGVQAKVYVNGLLAGKAFKVDDGQDADVIQATAVAWAVDVARRRMEKWRKGVALWDEMEGQ